MEENASNNPNQLSRRDSESCQNQYFALMEHAGSYGRYQKLSLFVWCIMWLVTGSLLLGTPFFFYNPPFNCQNDQSFSPQKQTCEEYVCSLPKQSRSSYIHNSVKTIATEFQDFECGNNGWKLNLLSSLIYFGSFVGYVIVPTLADNLGRKKTILIAIGLAIIGLLLVGFAQNLVMVGLGFFITGVGSDTSINICFNYITETVENKHRQKHSVIIQMFFSLGGVVNIPYFYFIGNWRVILWVFFIVPSVITFVIIWKFIEDTPFFLIKLKSEEEVYEAISRIIKINQKKRDEKGEGEGNGDNGNGNGFDQVNMDTPNSRKSDSSQGRKGKGKEKLMEKIEQLKNQFLSLKGSAGSKIFTAIDLFRYASIRTISIVICIISFCIYLLYYGPLMLISKFSFSIYINAAVVTFSQLCTYPLCYYLIDRVKRKKCNIFLFGMSLLVSTVLIFVIAKQCGGGESEGSSTCNFMKVFELMLIFVFRFCVSLEFAIFLIYCNEIFPTQIRGLGIGVSSCLGTVASTCSPYIFGSQINSNSSTSKIMIVFAVLSLSCMLLSWKFLPQTRGEPIQDEILELAGSSPSTNHKQPEHDEKGHVELVEVE